MKRRDFLTRTGASLAGALAAAASLPAAAGAEAGPVRLLRPIAGGFIVESLDDGASWQPAASFGSDRHVAEIVSRGDVFYARIEFGNSRQYGFWLSSGDGRTWRTTDGPDQA